MGKYKIKIQRKQMYVEEIDAEVIAKSQKAAEKDLINLAKQDKLTWVKMEAVIGSPRISVISSEVIESNQEESVHQSNVPDAVGASAE